MNNQNIKTISAVVNEKLVQHPQFSAVNTKISFADFCRAMYAPIYNEQGESEYYIELYHHLASDHKFRWFGFKNGKSSYESMRKRLLTGALSKHCMYYSVCPRDRQIQDKEDGRKIRTTRADITVATACWLDFDYKHFSSDICEADDMIIDQICSMNPFPSIIVKTPGGYHCYFLLEDKYPVEDVCYTNQRMENRWGADHCSDATRLMRIPMGKHFKESGDGKPVTIIHFDDTLRYTLDDFDHYPAVSVQQDKNKMAQIAALPPNETPLDFELLSETFKDTKLVAKIEAPTLTDYHALLSDSTSMKSRSERDFHIILQLLKSDVSVTDIRNIFVTFPCGDRYRENGSGDRYLITQINAAIERLNQEFSIEIVMKNSDDVEYI